MTRWKLEDAKNRFSELVRRARSEGPQLVTRHGRKAVVILSAEEYEKLAEPGDLVTFLKTSPLAEAMADEVLVLERSRDVGRGVSL